MTEREKAVAAPETHFLFKYNFSCIFFGTGYKKLLQSKFQSLKA